MANSARLISLPLPIKTFAKGERPVVGKAIDIWALGVTLYCLLFGRTPFNAPNEYELFNVIWNEPILVPETMGIERQSLEFDPTDRSLDGPVQRDSRELIDLLRKLLEKDPRKRIKLEDVKVSSLHSPKYLHRSNHNDHLCLQGPSMGTQQS
jgi:serine/threonine protein kinase